MTPSFVREQRRDTLALALHLLDPIALVAVGIAMLPTATHAWHVMFAGGQGVSFHTVVLMWAIVLIAGSISVAVRSVLHGFSHAELASTLVTRAATFCSGAAFTVVAVGLLWLDVPVPQTVVFAYAELAAVMTATAVALLWGAYSGFYVSIELARVALTAQRTAMHNRAQLRGLTDGVTLCGGLSSGIFHGRNLTVGAPLRGEVLLYGGMSAKRGTLVVGAPGSSKTRAKMYPDLFWGLRSAPNAGALIFITKRRATEDCAHIASLFRTPDKIHVVGVGPGRAHIDITGGMTHESIGDAVQDGLGASHSDFWRQGPSAFIEGFVELVRMLRGETIAVPAVLNKQGHVEKAGYSVEIGDVLPSLLRVTSLNDAALNAVFEHGAKKARKLPTEAAYALTELLHELRDRVLPLLQRDAKLAEELRQSVLPQLQPFGRGLLREAFCDANGLDLALLEEGHVILVEVDEAVYPRAVGTVIRMIFRRIVQMARERTASHRIKTLNPILLLCDEYTNYAATGHVAAWNTVRESNFCSTVGITSISALTKQLGGDYHAADAIVANFANKFFFEVDDQATRKLAAELIGQSVTVRRGTSEASSQSFGGSWNAARAGSHQSESSSRTESETEYREAVIDADIWRSLGAERDCARAIAFVRTPQGVRTDLVVFGVLDPSEHLNTASPHAYGLRS